MNYRPELEPVPRAVPTEKFVPDQRVVTLQDSDASPQAKEAAFAEIYGSFAGPLNGFVRKMVDSPEVAEEIVQESLLNAWKSIDKFDAHDENSSLSAWLYKITRNRTLNTLRGPKNRKGKGDVSYEDTYAIRPDAHGSEDDDPVATHVLQKEEIEIVGTLSEAVREALSWDPDLTYEETAARYGITVPAVKSRLVRAREASQKARAQLGLTEAEKAEIKEEKKAARRARREARKQEKKEDDRELAAVA